jgi:hypothetical protein
VTSLDSMIAIDAVTGKTVPTKKSMTYLQEAVVRQYSVQSFDSQTTYLAPLARSACSPLLHAPR